MKGSSTTATGKQSVSIVENVICLPDTMHNHPELFHYTRPAAFEGIVRSQTLWCSHYSEMLDVDEVRLMRGLLPRAVAPHMDALVEKLDPNLRRFWDRAGGGAKTARDLVNSLYGAVFDGQAAYSALEPYLFSFSTHAADSSFDREHGIHGQWNQYGAEGYCLVFDIAALANMLVKEGDARFWAWLMLEPVRYADSPVEDIFPELIDASADTLHQFLNGIKFPNMAVPEFLRGTTLLKAASYKSEREVRIVAIPGTAEAAKDAGQQYPSEFDPAVPLPEIKLRPDTGKRYIALFDGLEQRLPIKRVIVGPGARQTERLEHARLILGDHVPATISQCP